mmetsp:Transcript_32944/g.38344  ORF Transcript_32944/g.38344 Transcript_32944/m.38344 type:complete len:798 (-) Transcript_32944:30-2423(-)
MIRISISGFSVVMTFILYSSFVSTFHISPLQRQIMRYALHNKDVFHCEKRAIIHKKCRNLEKLRSNSPNEEVETTPLAETTPFTTVCGYCNKTFETRNSLFRHLRNDPTCSTLANDGNQNSGITMKKDSVALLIGYKSYSHHMEENLESGSHIKNDNDLIRESIQNAFTHALNKKFNNNENCETDDQFKAQVITTTQASFAKLRHHLLSQENGVSATGDVMTLSYRYPIKSTLLDERKSFRESQRSELFSSLLSDVISFLSNDDDERNSYTNMNRSKPNSTISNVQILSGKLLPSDTYFHAESRCTQRIYHYLLPLKWLSRGTEIEKWYTQNTQHNKSNPKSTETIKTNYGIRGENRISNPSPDELRVLKNILRKFESVDAIFSDQDDDMKLLTKKRYGRLAMKKFKAWHNFADPTLKGAASPNNKPVWRALDRCRIAQLLTHESNNDVVAVIEFRGDAFIQQQIRRIIGTTVAISNGWLPFEFIDISTSPDVFIETPLAPNNHIYLAGTRFHFDELKNKGRSIFHETMSDEDEYQHTTKVQRNILERYFDQNSPSVDQNESFWLSTIRDEVAPRIKKSLIQLDGRVINNKDPYASSCPPSYRHTLSLLQQISNSGRWPTTSTARSKVIKRNTNVTTDVIVDDKSGRSGGGSFTIINPKYMDGILMNDPSKSNIRVPLGNILFPDVVEAVFDLEESISTSTNRQASSHCAVNCNAQFTPHIDSGRGSGQSLSMIVGLGSYAGGELFVEGETNDICYNPLEFDGWRERHWTAPFNGERFSLVWFTPEIKGINNNSKDE